LKLASLKKIARDKKAEFIDLKFSDLPGSWHHITVPISSLGQKLFTDGIGIDGSSMPGFSKIERGDMIVIPVPGTAFMDPFFDSPTLSMICDIYDSGVKMTPYREINKRYICSYRPRI
jgi:glutamine synthetase